jgi:hypothetical protein
MVKSMIFNHYLIKDMVDVNMKNANEASLYCRRLESITSYPHKMCSSNSAGKITKAYYSTCVAVADLVLDTPFFTEALPVEYSVVD